VIYSKNKLYVKLYNSCRIKKCSSVSIDDHPGSLTMRHATELERQEMYFNTEISRVE